MDKELAKLTDSEFEQLQNDGKDYLLNLASGKVLIKRDLSYLRSVKDALLQCVDAGLSYAEISRSLKAHNPLLNFTARQIKEVCEEGKKKTRTSRSTKKPSSASKTATKTQDASSQSQSPDSSDVLPRTHRNLSNGEEV